MPGSKTVGQMFDTKLEPLRGWSGRGGLVTALEKVAPINTSQTNKIYAGSAMHMNSSQQFTLGRNNTLSTATAASLIFFAFADEDDPDINGQLGNIMGGYMMGFCCLGPFELESTQIADAQTFVLGSYLTTDDGSGGAGTGKLQTGTFGTDIICGIVSGVGEAADGTFVNAHGVSVVRFYTWFMTEHVSAD